LNVVSLFGLDLVLESFGKSSDLPKRLTDNALKDLAHTTRQRRVDRASCCAGLFEAGHGLATRHIECGRGGTSKLRSTPAAQRGHGSIRRHDLTNLRYGPLIDNRASMMRPDFMARLHNRPTHFAPHQSLFNARVCRGIRLCGRVERTR
jgi:hypothetical protein